MDYSQETGARGVHRLNAALLALLLVGSFALYRTLPERFPTHYGPAGVEAWTETSFLAWMMLPLLGVAMAALNYVLARWVVRRPDLSNFPGKDRFLTLPAERQRLVMETVADLLYRIAAGELLLFCVVQWAAWSTARGGDARGPLALVLALAVIGLPSIVLLSLSRMRRVLDDQLRRVQLGE